MKFYVHTAIMLTDMKWTMVLFLIAVRVSAATVPEEIILLYFCLVSGL